MERGEDVEARTATVVYCAVDAVLFRMRTRDRVRERGREWEKEKHRGVGCRVQGEGCSV